MKKLSREQQKVAVLLGGPPGEHPISLKTGAAAIKALSRLGYAILPVLIEESGEWVLGESSPVSPAQGLHHLSQEQCAGAFIALHGPFGEDGTIQALLESIGLGYQGSGVRSSAMAMNKTISKVLLNAQNLPVAPEVTVSPESNREDVTTIVEQKLGYPVFVKPAHMGSSVGAARAENREELNRAIDTGLAVDTSVLVEPLLVGQELTCGVLAREGSHVMDPLPSILIEPVGHAFFDFESKYTPGHNRELCPAPIPEELEQRLRQLALDAHDALGCRDMSRTDFIVTEDGPVILEVNTLPGLTEASLIPKSAAAAQLSFDDLVDRLMQRAISRSA